MAIAAPPRSSLIELDEAEFGRALSTRPFGVKHNLVEHPLLSLEAIAGLADRLPPVSVERHSADQPLVLPGGAPELQGRPSDTVRGIEDNRCWMVLWYLEQDPSYRELLDACLAPVAELVPREEGGLCQPESFLFLSAPGAVTPVHFDAEHNFLLQIQGSKEMHVCRFERPEEEIAELDRYYDGGHRNLSFMPPEDTTFVLQPGDGVYVYPHAPHWVQNGDRVSISLSITFRTRRSQRVERVHRFNARLRRKTRVHPAPAGVRPRNDNAKAAAELLWSSVRKNGLRPHHG